jgi:signal transduction histidine kinase
MSNVSKYALEGTRVYIDIIEDAEEVNYTIKNISKEPLNINVEDLSKRFVRGDSSRTTEGSGLGLSIALNLATIMGARLDLSIDGDLFKASLKLTKSNEMLPSPLVEETSECDTEEFFIEIEDNL